MKNLEILQSTLSDLNKKMVELELSGDINIEKAKEVYKQMKGMEWLIRKTCNAEVINMFTELEWFITNYDDFKKKRDRFMELKAKKDITEEEVVEIHQLHAEINIVIERIKRVQQKH